MTEGDLGERVSQGWQTLRRARHSARLPRYLALAVLLVFLALGLRAAFLPSAATIAPAPRATADAPSEDLALQFARAYLSFNASHPGARARALAPFLSGGQLDPEAGLTPAGTQSVRWAEVASDQPALAGGRLITVAAAVSTQRRPLYLALTIAHPPGRPLSLLGYPALVGAPARAAPPPAPPREPLEDPALSRVIDRVLANYLAGSARDLEADLSPDAEVTLPTRTLRLEEVQRLEWLGGKGSAAVLATLTATDAVGSTYTLCYELGLRRGERPYVDYIELVPTAG